MRIAFGFQMDSARGSLNSALENLSKAADRVTSGKKLTAPSDDPTLANRAMSLRSAINGIEQYKENTDSAKGVVDTSMSTVSDIADQIQLLQQAATQAGDSGLDSDSRTAIVAQIETIKSKLLNLADTKYLGKNIFSGTMTNTSPVTTNPATPAVPPYIYQGNTDPISIQIQASERTQINVTANEIFNLDGSAGASIKDVFTIIDDLETAVKAGDVPTCSGLLNDIDKNYSNVLGIQGRLGTRSAMLEDNSTALKQSKDRMSEMLSSVEDVDLTTAVIDLQKQQNIYQAALSVTTAIMQGDSLVDYLR